MRRQAIDYNQIFINHIFDKGLGSRIYKELSKSYSKKTTQLNKWINNWMGVLPKAISNKRLFYITNQGLFSCLSYLNKNYKFSQCVFLGVEILYLAF
jgi:hypothetical protein